MATSYKVSDPQPLNTSILIADPTRSEAMSVTDWQLHKQDWFNNYVIEKGAEAAVNACLLSMESPTDPSMHKWAPGAVNSMIKAFEKGVQLISHAGACAPACHFAYLEGCERYASAWVRLLTHKGQYVLQFDSISWVEHGVDGVDGVEDAHVATT